MAVIAQGQDGGQLCRRVLPKEVLAKLRVRKGDSLYLSETPDGIELSPYDPDFDQELEAARTVMRRYRNALRKLAR
jgi:putative addiction module antidote